MQRSAKEDVAALFMIEDEERGYGRRVRHGPGSRAASIEQPLVVAQWLDGSAPVDPVADAFGQRALAVLLGG